MKRWSYYKRICNRKNSQIDMLLWRINLAIFLYFLSVIWNIYYISLLTCGYKSVYQKLSYAVRVVCTLIFQLHVLTHQCP